MKSVAVSECHWKFLVTVTKMYSDSHYLPQISLPFHQVFFIYSVALHVKGLLQLAYHGIEYCLSLEVMLVCVHVAETNAYNKLGTYIP